MLQQQHCPICETGVAPSERYPRYVCSDCAAQAVSADGLRLVFSNRDMSGGFIATYADNGEEHPGHTCYIEGVKCHADEARFGGIVIQCEPSIIPP